MTTNGGRTRRIENPVLRFADTHTLRVENGRALRDGYAHTLSAAQIAGLDPKGRHVVRASALNGLTAAGEEVPVHVQCRLMLKMLGRNQPEEGWLDIGLFDYLDLPTGESAQLTAMAAEIEGGSE